MNIQTNKETTVFQEVLQYKMGQDFLDIQCAMEYSYVLKLKMLYSVYNCTLEEPRII